MKISIITVCFNSAKTIADTLKSVREQTHIAVEHIIIDGASTDDTLNVIAAEGQHIIKIVSERDDGIYDAMNKGIAIATGDVIGFINADDFYASPHVLEKIAAVFTDPKVDVCYGDLFYVKQNDTSSIVRYWKSSKFKTGDFAKAWAPPHPTFFARCKIYKSFGGFDLSYKIAADFELMMRFLEQHRLQYKYIPEVLVKMRVGGTSNRSLKNIIKQNKEIIRALDFYGLQSSLIRLIAYKIISKGRQFLTRPRS